jgi:DOMON domain/Eukaryotic cytochrome b561
MVVCHRQLSFVSLVTFFVLAHISLLLLQVPSVHSFFWNNKNETDAPCALHGAPRIRDDVLLRYVVNPERKTITIELIYNGIGWIGFAFTTKASMIPSTSVIGIPSSNRLFNGRATVAKYRMKTKRNSGVQMIRKLGDDEHVARIDQNKTHTVLLFTRTLKAVDYDEVEVVPNRMNRFIWAVGHDNDLAQHKYMGSERILLDKNCQSSTDGNGSSKSNETDALLYVGTFHSEADGVVIAIAVNSADETITVEMTYSGRAWIGFAFPESNDQMIGSMAVIGLAEPGLPVKYDLNTKSIGGINRAPDSRQDTLTDSIFQQNDTHTYMKFTKPVLEANEPTILIGKGIENNFIYAIGTNNELAMHETRVSFVITLDECKPQDATCTGAVGSVNSNTDALSTTSSRAKWKAHGFCMALAWVILVPTAIISSLFRSLYSRQSDTWFHLHRAINLVAFFFTILGFFLAVGAIKSEGGSFGTVRHHKVGLVVFIFTIFQVIVGLLRPSPTIAKSSQPEDDDGRQHSIANFDKSVCIDYEGDDASHVGSMSPTAIYNNDAVTNSDKIKDSQGNDGDEKTTYRTGWEVLHRMLGAITLLLAWLNCNTGIALYDTRYNVDKSGLLSGFYGSIIGFVMFLCVYQGFKQQWKCSRSGVAR